MEKNIRNAFICPNCVQKSGTGDTPGISIKNMGTMFDDTLTITVECVECHSIWKTYVKVEDFTAEALYIPKNEAEQPKKD